MKHAFAQDAVLSMEPEADERAPGAAVTLALCGHWDHDPPCPLAPHHVGIQRRGDDLKVRVLFVTSPDAEYEVRDRIRRALSGLWPLPEEFSTSWKLLDCRPSEVRKDELQHAERLMRN